MTHTLNDYNIVGEHVVKPNETADDITTARQVLTGLPYESIKHLQDLATKAGRQLKLTRQEGADWKAKFVEETPGVERF